LLAAAINKVKARFITICFVAVFIIRARLLLFMSIEISFLRYWMKIPKRTVHKEQIIYHIILFNNNYINLA